MRVINMLIQFKNTLKNNAHQNLMPQHEQEAVRKMDNTILRMQNTPNVDLLKTDYLE